MVGSWNLLILFRRQQRANKSKQSVFAWNEIYVLWLLAIYFCNECVWSIRALHHPIDRRSNQDKLQVFINFCNVAKSQTWQKVPNASTKYVRTQVVCVCVIRSRKTSFKVKDEHTVICSLSISVLSLPINVSATMMFDTMHCSQTAKQYSQSSFMFVVFFFSLLIQTALLVECYFN